MSRSKIMLLSMLLLSGLLGLGIWIALPTRGEVFETATAGELGVPEFIGTVAEPKPLPPMTIPQNPFMTDHQFGRIHHDTYNSAVVDTIAPLGHELDVSSRVMGTSAGLCITMTVAKNGIVYANCISLPAMRLVALHPHTLEILALHNLPARPFPPVKGDTSGGVYYYLNEDDNPVILNADNHLQIFEYQGDLTGGDWEILEDYDLNPYLPEDVLTQSSVIPDWDGRIWFIAQQGIVGYIDRATEEVQILTLPEGEVIQNDLAADPEGVYFASDQALYQVSADSNGIPQIDWREVYERGVLKPSKVSLGSGTTPTLLGDDLIAIGDNDSPQMNALVYHRSADFEGDRLICKVPVFGADESTTEGTFVGYDRSLVLVNTYGYEVPRGDLRDVASGMVRIDIREDLSGCDIVWESDIVTVAPPRLVTSNGLLYVYTIDMDMPRDVQAWYLTTVDFATGETVFSNYLGSGEMWNNVMVNYQMSPDGTVYMGTLNGIIAFKETAQ